MKSIAKIFVCYLLISLNSYSNAQEGRAVEKIIKLILEDGKEAIQISERTLSSDERILLRNVDDRELIDEIKKAHPNEKFSEIHLSSTEMAKVLKKQSEKDNPVQAEIRRQQEFSETDHYLWYQTMERHSTDRSMKSISPQGYFDHVETFISIPSSKDEYIKTFKSAKDDPVNNTIAIYQKISAAKYKNTSFPKSADEFIKTLSQKSNNPLSLIGHNENGNLYFPDGSTVAISELDKIAKKFDRIVIYLSCNAASYTSNPAVAYYLDYATAIHLNNFITNEVSYFKKDITKKEAEERINSLLSSYAFTKGLKYKLKLTAYVTAGVSVAYGLYEIKESDK
jgi:hypothetical protein